VWLAWAVAAATSVQLAPSPVYVATVIAMSALIVEVYAPDGPYRRAFGLLVAAGCLFAGVRVLITALTVHLASTTVIVSLPSLTVPRILGGFALGGPVSLGAVLQSVSEGLAIVGIMACFGAFNAVVSHYELVQSAPRAFHELGLIVTVALAFVPATIESVAAAREADRARTGALVVRRGRALRLAVPVLERGLERAVSLSESMDSRGFAPAGSAGERLGASSGVGALLALGGALVALVSRAPLAAIAFGAAGVAFLGVAIWSTGRSSRRPRYRPRRMEPADWAAAGACMLAPVALGVLALMGSSSLWWSTSPLRWPTFSLPASVALLALLSPLARRPAPVQSADPEALALAT
jgi:energy-coupling factor transport system permease protein